MNYFLLFGATILTVSQIESRVIPIGYYNMPGKLATARSQYSTILNSLLSLAAKADISLDDLNSFGYLLSGAQYQTPELQALEQDYSNALAAQCKAQLQADPKVIAIAQQALDAAHDNLAQAFKNASGQQPMLNPTQLLLSKGNLLAQKLVPYKTQFNSLYANLEQAVAAQKKQSPCDSQYFALVPTGNALLEQVFGYLSNLLNR